jgi:thiamine pyrophosphokinase
LLEKGKRLRITVEEAYRLILANGPWPNISLLQPQCERAVQVIACDGALDRALAADLPVDTVIGDMDSVQNKTLAEFLKQGGEVVEIKDQESNDFTKAVNYCVEKGQTRLVVFGGLGHDLGHEWGNILTSVASKLQIEMVHDGKSIQTLEKDISYSIEMTPGEEFSLFAIPFCDGISLTGCSYELHQHRLEMGSQGVHNIAKEKQIQLSFEQGTLVMIKSFR